MILFNILGLLAVAGAVALLRRTAPERRPRLALLLGPGLAFVGIAGAATCSGGDPFELMQLLAWLVFLHLPLYLSGATVVLWARARRTAALAGVAAAAVLAVAVDAFLVEPHWLEITRLRVESAKVERRLRLAVIADLQTDAPGAFEEEVLRQALAARPDLVLLAGDYLHCDSSAEYAEQARVLNDLFRRVGLAAPLGVFAVPGNVEWPGLWSEIFAGLPVTLFVRSGEVDLGPLVLTGLRLADSGNARIAIPARDKLHVVLGHVPDFALGRVEADLLVAGHTHGGQVQLPFIGPLLTLCQVPRAWASGVTDVGRGRTLVVSRGLGMERSDAPRLRFLCRPELVLIDVVSE